MKLLTGSAKHDDDSNLIASQAAALALREEQSERRRRLAQQHHHKDVWTKDPHGGPYRQVGVDHKTGYDALEMPNGVAIQPEIGYEKPQSGPTTNFVGNHMTQGAIDLVQAQLMQEDIAHSLLKAQQYDALYGKPKLITDNNSSAKPSDECPSSEIVHHATRRSWTAVQHFCWTDTGEYIQIQIPPPCREAKTECGISFSAQPRQIRAELSWRVSGNGGGRSAADLVFGISRTFAEIDVSHCMCAQSAKTEDVIIRLRKVDVGVEWMQLEVPVKTDLCKIENGDKISAAEEAERLSRLRRAIRQQRQNKKPKDGKLYDIDIVQERTASVSLAYADEQGEVPLVELEEAYQQATEDAKHGDYAKAAIRYRWVLAHLKASDDGAMKAKCFQELGMSQMELGDLDGALTSFSIALEASTRSCWSKDERIELLIKRANLNEQTERLEDALRDYREVTCLDPTSLIGLHGTSRVQKSLKLGAQLRQEEQRLSGRESHLVGNPSLPKSVPRPSMPIFRNRGKSGKPF